VIRVGQVGFAILLGIKGKDETMGEPFVEFFGAVIGSPFDRGDLGDLLF
jgi:hypothetical protein